MAGVEGCQLRRACTQSWARLEVLAGQRDVRFCNVCQRAVHWAEDEVALRRLEARGKCVAIAWGSEAGVGAPQASKV
jgi:hypothetical protein